jgi:predicted nucleic acid-binding protein
MLKRIADAGLLVALLNRDDEFHAWAREVFASETPPFYTCDVALAEAGWRTGEPGLVMQMVADGDIILDFDLGTEARSVWQLLRKYDRMDIADACLVRMSELHRNCKIWTVDRTDFQIYRRFGKEPIPTVFPD